MKRHNNISFHLYKIKINFLTIELVPSSTGEASKGQVLGFITELGGVTSHAALIARSKGIPYIANISIHTLHSYLCSPMIIECNGAPF